MILKYKPVVNLSWFGVVSVITSGPTKKIGGFASHINVIVKYMRAVYNAAWSDIRPGLKKRETS